jgi:hypothetical protein
LWSLRIALWIAQHIGLSRAPEAMEGLTPGIASLARSIPPSSKTRARTPLKPDPARMDGCLTTAHLTKDRAAKALRHIMIPPALDNPA